MYAVVQTQGRQFRVSEGDEIVVDRMEAEVGSTVELDKVLMIGGDAARLGAPYLDGVKVVVEVINHKRGPKIDIYKYRRRQRYRKSMGFRAEQTTIRIQSIEG